MIWKGRGEKNKNKYKNKNTKLEKRLEQKIVRGSPYPYLLGDQILHILNVFNVFHILVGGSKPLGYGQPQGGNPVMITVFHQFYIH